MAGFCLELRENPNGARPLHLVSLGGGEVTEEFSAHGVRALWSRWSDSRQLWVRRAADQLWLIEGQPDRWPGVRESVNDWLPGRWGSFRGFAADARTGTATVFGDPAGTRPVFYALTSAGTYVSDKLATLAALTPSGASVDWDALLEQLLTGVVFSGRTTLAGAIQLGPGEVLELSPRGIAAERRLEMPRDPEITPSAVARSPGRTLFTALTRAVGDVWCERDAALLLSGGLDSRLVLRLGGAGRTALTVTTRENVESRIARRVAEACEAEFRHVSRPPEQYHQVVQYADLLNGAMDHPVHAHFLGMLSEWRSGGLLGVAHAFLFDSLFKGYDVFPAGEPDRRLVSADGRVLAVSAHLLQTKCDRRDEQRLVGALSTEGFNRLREQVAVLSGSFPSREVDGLETAIEYQSRRRLARQSAYTNMLSWMEEQDVYSVSVHPSLWTWIEASRPRDRYRARAFRRALRMAGLDLILLPSSSTGLPALVPPHLLDGTRLTDRWWYAGVRSVWRLVKPRALHENTSASSADEHSWPPYGPIFRAPRGRDLLEEGLHELVSSPLFEATAIEALWAEFLAGANAHLHTVLALAACGRWCKHVRELRSLDAARPPWLRVAPESHRIEAIVAR